MTKVIQAVIIDDEAGARLALKTMLEKYCPEVHVLGEADNIISGGALIKAADPQVIFLDIEMPSGSGLDLLKELGSIQAEVIFTTAYSHYAIQAIKIFALDYLLKPINRHELISAVAKLKRNEVRITHKILDLIREQLDSKDQYAKHLAIPSVKGLEIIKVNDILYCEGDRNYTMFHLSGKEKLLSSKTLKEYENVLSPRFFIRAHQKYLINIIYVKRYLKGRGGTLVMADGTSIDVSHSKKVEVLRALSLTTQSGRSHN